MRILGIDPGSRRCGYGVVEQLAPGRVRYVECGVIEPDPDARLELRLVEIAAGLREVIAELRPGAVAVEGVFHGANASAALKLGHARGVALLAAGEARLDVFEYAPATIKRSVAGSGIASKLQVATMVRALCSLRSAPRLDASDALAAAICHAFHTRAIAPARSRARAR
jgi:crossover junction endodeoxyribonuclease RuvC